MYSLSSTIFECVFEFLLAKDHILWYGIEESGMKAEPLKKESRTAAEESQTAAGEGAFAAGGGGGGVI